jgi:hypothetical protein
MFWRGAFRVLAVLVLVGLAIGIGTAIYNAGVTAGLADAANQAVASGDAVPLDPRAYGYGAPYLHGPFGFGFGFFWILFWILGIFLIIGLVRAAFGGGWGGPGRRGWGDRRDRVEAWHRELHEQERRDGPPGSTGP